MFGMKKKKEEGPAPFSFKDLFSDSQQERATMAKDQIAALLNTTPEALAAFEASYQRDILNNTTENGHFFEVSAKQAAETIPSVDPSEAAKALYDRIVKELISQTPILDYDGKKLQYLDPQNMLGNDDKRVTADEINALPEPMRPQLSGDLMLRDMPQDSTCASLLFFYKEWQEATNPKKKTSPTIISARAWTSWIWMLSPMKC